MLKTQPAVSHAELLKCPGVDGGFVLQAMGSRKMAQWGWSFGEVPPAAGGGACDASGAIAEPSGL